MVFKQMLSFQKAVELGKEKHLPPDILAWYLLKANRLCLHKPFPACSWKPSYLGKSIPLAASLLPVAGPCCDYVCTVRKLPGCVPAQQSARGQQQSVSR